MSVDDLGRRAAAAVEDSVGRHPIPPAPERPSARLWRLVGAAAGAAAVAAVIAIFVFGVFQPSPAPTPPATEPPVTAPPGVTATTAPTTAATAGPTSVPATAPTTTVPLVEVDPTLVGVAPLRDPDETVLSVPWGPGTGDIGLDVKQFGPCCFSVGVDGTVYVMQIEPLVLKAFPPDGPPEAVIEFDAADFVPLAMTVTPDDVFVVIGQTNEEFQPRYVRTYSRTGQLIDQAPTEITQDADLRATPDGRVYGRLFGAWHAIAEHDGTALSGSFTAQLRITRDTTLAVTIVGEDLTVWRTGPDGPEGWSIPVSAVVPIYTTQIDGRVVVVLSTDRLVDSDQLLVVVLETDADPQAFLIDDPRWAFENIHGANFFGYDDRLYRLWTTPDGVRVVAWTFP